LIEIDAVCHGCPVNDAYDVSQGVSYRREIRFGYSIDKLADLLLQQRYAKLR
jgi:hypothetical protein